MNNHDDKTDDRKVTGDEAAFPSVGDVRYNADFVTDYGFTRRQYAAIHLRIPDSGIDWLDKMIAKAERRDLSAQIFGSIHTQGIPWNTICQNIDTAVAALLRAKEQ